MKLVQERRQIVFYGKKMITAGLTRGTGGNLSIYRRRENLIAISPSGIDYFDTRAADVTVVDTGGARVEGKRVPSTEMPMHLAVYARRNDLHALVHTHSPFATTLACLQLDLPPLHYALGFAGAAVRCAPYATFGSAQLARAAVRSMQNAKAVLLANHGLLAGGRTLAEAFYVAEMVEYCAELYCRALSLGKPKIISAREMRRVSGKLSTYGK
jgi:L-fuculose-phosphate aldolase